MARGFLALVGFTALSGCTQSEPASPAPAASAGAETPAPAPVTTTERAPDSAAAATPVEAVVASFERFNAHDLDGALALASFEVRCNTVGGQTLTGKGHLRKHWEELIAAFPNLKRTLKRVIHAGETVAAEYVVTGNQQGAFRGIAPSSKAIGYDGLMIFHLAGGEVTEITVYEDDLAWRRQLGADKGPVPPQAPPPTGEPEVVEGDGDRALVSFVKDWYAAAPAWNKACDATHCAADVSFTSAATGEVYATQQRRRDYLDALGAGAKDLVVEDVWVEPAGSYFVTFVTLKNVLPSEALGLTPAKQPISLSVAEVIQLEGGKLKSVTSYFNRQQAVSQLSAK